MITENLSTLKIHKLNKEQYNREYANGNLDENALYLTPEEDGNVIVKDDNELIFENSSMNQTGGIHMFTYEDSDGVPKLEVLGLNNDEQVIMRGIATPTDRSDAANKGYVDDAIANAGSSSSGLGFMPVQQGGGKDQLDNKVYIGWSGNRLKVTVDETDLGNVAFDKHLGMQREFNTGLINSSVYTTESNAAKIYVVTFKVGTSVIGNPLCHSCTFDYMACASLGNVMDIPLDDVHTATMRINTDKTVTFGVSRSDDQPHTISIAHICGYY